MAIRPLHDRVVIKRVEAEEKTQSGIVLPGTAAEKPDIVEEISVGPGMLLENGNVQELSVNLASTVVKPSK